MVILMRQGKGREGSSFFIRATSAAIELGIEPIRGVRGGGCNLIHLQGGAIIKFCQQVRPIPVPSFD